MTNTILTDTTYNRLTTTLQVQKPQATFTLKPATQFSVQQLTDVYNQTRVDYLVPMPMSVAKMKEYIQVYDVDLAQSVVAVSGETPLGLGLLGIRGDTAWVTRLGVTPHGRQRGIGRGLMDNLLENVHRLGLKVVILEVIKNNVPAQTLFESLGFEVLRDLLVIRRPPKPTNMAVSSTLYIEALGYMDALKLLKTRADTPSWVTANESLNNAGNLSALKADLPGKGQGWLVYQNSVFQLSRLVLHRAPNAAPEVTRTLLQHLHWRHPVQDTVVENVPLDDTTWPVFESLGYMVSFMRVEMRLAL